MARKNKNSVSVKNRFLFLCFVPIILLVILISIIKKTVYLSSGPTAEKDCHLLYPLTTSDSSKTNTIVMENQKEEIPFFQKGGVIDDISCLNKTTVFGITKPKTEEEIQKTILFANDKKLKVSLAGIRHSMGGQAFVKNALILDMTNFNQMSVDKESKILTVQSGATWHDIQNFLNPEGLSVKAMQSSDIFTVGGSISVNAHGMDHRVGSLGSTIISMRIMLSDGSIQTISRDQNPELFQLVIGGYGLFGVILDVKVDVTSNEIYERDTQVVRYKDFPEHFEEVLKSGDSIGLMYGHLSGGPNSFLNEIIIYKYKKATNFKGDLPALSEKPNVALKRFFLNLGKTGPIGLQIKWWAERYIQPRFEACAISRNNAMGEPEACWVSRNQEMHESGKFLRNNLRNDTDILQEYFIPRDKFVLFVDGMRGIFRENKSVVLNAGVRVVNKEDNFLNYAPEDSFAMVLYLNQKTTEEDNQRMEKVTQELVDLSIGLGGKPYLPYQLYFTKAQLQKAYPNIDEFFELKKQYDPELVFANTFYNKYSPTDTK